MSPITEVPKALTQLFRRRRVVDLGELFAVLETHSRMTVFRRLSSLDYMTSYSHAGRYYTLRDIAVFDAHGLWQHAGALFSRDGTLKDTLVRLVHETEAGQFHRELQTRLGLRVQNTLADLVSGSRLGRESIDSEYLYISADAERGRRQLAQRQRLIRQDEQTRGAVVTPAIIIEVLLEVIHGSVVRIDAKRVSARLLARGVHISADQVTAIFEQHGVSKKKARSR